jgi:hypothetical protein
VQSGFAGDNILSFVDTAPDVARLEKMLKEAL